MKCLRSLPKLNTNPMKEQNRNSVEEKRSRKRKDLAEVSNA